VNKHKCTAGRSRAAGNLLIDLVIGVVLLGLIAAMLAGTYSNLIQRSVDSFETTRATWMANSAMEVISGYPFADPVFVDGSIGVDGHESVMTTFDDIDDFDGYNFILESYPAYTAAAAVSWADISAGEIEEDVGPTSFKKIVVTAQNDMLSNPVSLTTIMSTAGSGGAQIIAEEEQNNSFDTAQEIPRTSFYVTANPDVGDANNPWATINSNMDYGRDDDYYQFELQAGETLILDIDYGYDEDDEVDGVDILMRLYNNQRVEKQWLDDSNTNLDGGAGSIDRRDPYLEWPAQDNGVYYVKVTSCQNDGTRCSDTNPTDTGNYVLNVTIIPTDESTGLGDD
jgi:hypothetical protein